MLIKEFRIVMPMPVEEHQVAHLWSVAQASKNETGGGEGVEVVANEPYAGSPHPPRAPLAETIPDKGQYTHKIYHLASKVPRWVRVLAPRGSMEFVEQSWNAFPYCCTIITNPEYMKDKFQLKIESLYLPDAGTTENAHHLPADLLGKREVVAIDIAHDPVRASDYKEDEDPKLYKSEKTGRGPLTDGDWKNTVKPVMCCYKLVSVEFVWFGLQSRVEKFIQSGEHRLFTNFHREVFCWTDKWYGMTMADIREIEEKTKRELDEMRSQGQVRGMVANE